MTENIETTVVTETPETTTQTELSSTGDKIHQDLVNFYTAQEEVQPTVDNQTENQTETESEEIEETAESGEVAEAEKTDETSVPVTESANFEALEDAEKTESEPIEFLGADELNKLYPRQNKDLVATAIQYSEAAKKGQEVINQIGGNEFIEPMANIAKGIKEGNPQSVFEGLVQAGNFDTLVDLIGQSTNLALVKSKEFQANPETKELGEKLEGISNIILQSRFGNEISINQIESLADFQNKGWLDAFSRWKDAGFVDPEEFEELLEADKDPAMFLSIRQEAETAKKEAAEAKQQLEQLSKQKQESETKQVAQVEIDFDKQTEQALDKVLNDVVLTTSVLRSRDGDSAEMKEEKAILREILFTDAQKALKTSKSRENLLTDFKSGKTDSEDYKRKVSAAINSAALAVKEKTKVFERIIAKLYGKTRNATIPTETKQAEKLPPTETTRFSNDKPKTIRDIDKDLEAVFAGL